MRRAVLLGCLLAPSMAAAEKRPKLPEVPEAVKKYVEHFEKTGQVPLPPEFRFNIPDVKEVVDIPGEQWAMGIPMKLKAVTSGKKFSDVYASVSASFREAGLFVVPPEQMKMPLSDPMLTGFDPHRLISYSVIFKANQDGTTTCILGEAHVGRREEKDPIVPTPSDAESPIQSAMEGMRTLAFTSDSPPEVIETFYRDHFLKKGYREIEPMLYQSGTSVYRVRAKRDAGKTRVMVLDSPLLPRRGLTDAQ